MTDSLDTLSDQELSERFAVEVVEMVRDDRGAWHTKEGVRIVGRNGSSDLHRTGFDHFATDANAVLPWLEKCEEVSNVFEDGWWFVGIERKQVYVGSFVSASAPTFARAACIALLRAKRAQKPIPA